MKLPFYEIHEIECLASSFIYGVHTTVSLFDFLVVKLDFMRHVNHRDYRKLRDFSGEPKSDIRKLQGSLARGKTVV